jgi:phosphoribosylamine---glycine ligase
LLKVLVIGNGAREHALVWKLSQSSQVAEIYAAPGNAGIATIATVLNIKPTDIAGLAKAAQERRIDLTVVGPEVPLAQGIVDAFESHGLRIFGPSKAAAQIEASKVFAKELMQKYGIPCASSKSFTSYENAKDYVKKQPSPIVIKADGLAAGKGVIIANTTGEALTALSDVMEKRAFGDAGNRVVIEECLVGKEVSLLAFTDGMAVVPMVPACDYKRVGDGDTGLNTGGMGSYSPPGFFGSEMVKKVKETLLEPVVKAMAKEGSPYKGVLYAGLMVTADGPRVMEFNCRFGDPETQAMLPRLDTDLVDIMLAVIDGDLNKIKIGWRKESCVGVILASGGYPGKYATGLPITGLDAVDDDVMVFHAGTKSIDGAICTDGGRVLTVTALGRDIAEARDKVYRNIPRITFKGCHYRRDIGLREVSG